MSRMRVGSYEVYGKRRPHDSMGPSTYDVYSRPAGVRAWAPDHLGRVWHIGARTTKSWRNSRQTKVYLSKWEAMFELYGAWMNTQVDQETGIPR